MLQQAPPKALGELAVLVVDETLPPAVDHAVLPAAQLLRHDAIGTDRLAAARLRSLRHLVHDTLADLPDGPVPRAAFAATGMMEASAAELLTLEWQTHVTPNMPAGASPKQRAAALGQAACNTDLGRRAMLAGALAALLAPDGPDASGRIALATTKAGARELHLHARRDIREGWKVPTLILDATLLLDWVRLTWPEAVLVADLAVETPHQRVRQIADGGFTLAALDADAPRIDAAERKRRSRNLDRLRVRLHTEARKHNGTVLVVTNKRIRARLEALGMPGNVEFAHFNALRGLDRWRDAAALIVVGWTLPPADAMERLAGALTGAALPATGYRRTEARRELADGSSLLSDEWRHPDPLAEALRWSTCDAELIQTIGRGRAVLRTAETPLDVLILGESIMPFAVELVPNKNPTPMETQLAHGPVAYAASAHAARAYRQLWGTEGAYRAAARSTRTNPYREPLIGECAGAPGTVRVHYQLAGPSHHPAVALVLQSADARAVIEADQGPLAWLKVDAPAPEPPTPTPPSPTAPTPCPAAPVWVDAGRPPDPDAPPWSDATLPAVARRTLL